MDGQEKNKKAQNEKRKPRRPSCWWPVKFFNKRTPKTDGPRREGWWTHALSFKGGGALWLFDDTRKTGHFLRWKGRRRICQSNGRAPYGDTLMHGFLSRLPGQVKLSSILRGRWGWGGGFEKHGTCVIFDSKSIFHLTLLKRKIPPPPPPPSYVIRLKKWNFEVYTCTLWWYLNPSLQPGMMMMMMAVTHTSSHESSLLPSAGGELIVLKNDQSTGRWWVEGVALSGDTPSPPCDAHTWQVDQWSSVYSEWHGPVKKGLWGDPRTSVYVRGCVWLVTVNKENKIEFEANLKPQRRHVFFDALCALHELFLLPFLIFVSKPANFQLHF